MYKALQALCHEFEQEFDTIPLERKLVLIELSDYIQSRLEAESINIVVICTHNSRRSHMGQIWTAVAADYYGIKNIKTFSGGTEATAFNPRAVEAFKRVGFDIDMVENEYGNHRYQIRWSEEMESYTAFSKRYNKKPNPKEKYAAVMVCTEADKGCPIVKGCDFRLSLPYEDPKAFDDTELESDKYDERLRQIGRELLYALSQVNN